MRYDNHNHTRYSNIRLRDALPTPEALIDKAIELGLAGISISEHECVSSHVKANKYYQEKIKEKYPNFKIGLSNEIYLVDEIPCENHYHYILTAIDEIGYRQIKELSTIAWLNSYSSKGLTRVDTLKKDLEEIVTRNPGHLIASSACIGGELGKSILGLTAAEKIGDKVSAEKYHNQIVNFILWNKKIFGDNFYIEVQPGISKEQITVNQRLLSISNCFNIKMIPTSDTHYLRPEDRYVHKAFLNSENKEREVDAFYQDAYLHSDEEMIEKFALSGFDSLFVQQLFDNSMELYNKIKQFSLFHPQQVPKVDVENYPICINPPAELKKYPNLYKMYQSEDKIDRYWINTCINKLKEINKFNEIYLTELEEEADVKTIIGNKLNTNMFAYPVCLAHYIKMMWECGSSIGVGRGSACSALNHYLLGITQLDPIEWDFPFFRYMNRDTDGLGDIDIDVCPSKVQTIVSKIREERGQKFNSNITNPLIRENLGAVYVCTFGTESSKSAVQTACRGYRSEDYPDGIDIDTSQYLSSLIPTERGFVWSIKDVYYGNPDKDRKPIPAFIQEVNNYPGLLDIMLGIEGCISRRGRHASGVLFNGEDPFEFNAYMKTPSGEIVSQYDLHDAEWCGAVKMDILVTEIQDKIVQTIKFLQEDNLIEKELSLKEAYDKYLHPDVLPLKDKATWHAIQEASTLDLFQLDSDIGRQGAKKVKPESIIEMSSVNGLIRLMNAGEGQETWIDKYVRFKNDRIQLLDEIEKYHLSETEKTALGKYLNHTHGIGISQEQMMRVLMDKDICNFSLKEANKARKIVSKKKMNEIPAFKEKVYNTAKSNNVANYVWDYVVAPGLGYSFSDIHSLSYSFIGFQSAYIATKWNPIYWDTACLVVNSGSLESDEDYEFDDDGEAVKKEKGSDYAKIAKAIGAITSKGIEVSLVNINTSDYGYKPDVEHNRILYGLKALSNISGDVVEKIKAGRPYFGIKDFMNRCPLTKTAMINLIKAGAFDEIETSFKSRKEIMVYYISQVCDAKKRLTLQNFNGLIQHNLVPKELELQVRVFNFTKYLKANKKVGKYFAFDDICIQFYEKFMTDYLDELEVINGVTCILQDKWDKIYKKHMDAARDWLKENQESVLAEYNKMLFMESWEKYAKGNTSHWEMEALCFYHGEHELAHIDNYRYGIVDFNELSPVPEVDYFFKRGNNKIPIYKLHRIAGTVLAKNDTRCSVMLLTTTGVVSVKFSRDYYAMFKKQISQVQPDGTKKIMEKGWFGRGNMLMVTGFRRDDQFVSKTYKSTDSHQLYKIDEVCGDQIKIRNERWTAADAFEEEDYE